MQKTKLSPQLSLQIDTQQSNNIQQLAHHEQLQRYSQKIEELAKIQERNRIAREVHDSLGHALTSLNIQMQTAVKLWDKDPVKAYSFLLQAQQLGNIAMQEMRQSIHNLREDAQDENPLEAKIEALVDDFRQGTGLEIDTDISCCDSVPLSISQTVYRIVQEALTNILKYSQATEVQIQLKSTQKGLHLAIEDNGKGFDSNQKPSGFGLKGIQERVAIVKGNFQLKTSPGNGCRIEIKISGIK